MLDKKTPTKTEKLAKQIRINVLRMTSIGNSSHIGAIFSMTDILAVLYGEVLNLAPENPSWKERDIFILSKGHGGAGVYAALALTGFFSPDELDTHYSNGSKLSGHVSHKGVPGVEFSTGSLGQGLSVASGIAKAAQLDCSTKKIFVLLGDGECNEGAIWEAALFANHHNLGNLIAIIDRNGLQSITTTEETLALEPLAEKWSAFGWNVLVVDGHNHSDLETTFRIATSFENKKPVVIIANTIKGKGVSFMENSVLWHYRSAQAGEFENALIELTAEDQK